MDAPPPVRVGCCGWALRQPEYVRRFTVIEVQQTFYHPPGPHTLERWRALAPPGFEFSVKAWQLVTHPASSPTYRRLRRPLSGRPEAYGSFQTTPEVMAAWEITIQAAVALGASFVVCQTPASFRPDEVAMSRVRRFFATAPRGPFRVGWEPRGAWPIDLVRDLCRELDLVHVVDPFVTEPQWGETAYLRLHGIGGYRYEFTDADLEQLLGKVPPGAWVMFNNTSMARDAARFRELAAKMGRLVR